MKIPDDILETLGRLGEDTAHYAWLAERHGVELLRTFVAKKDASARLFGEWFPRLTAFAAAKRADNPIPLPSSLSPVEQAWNRILEPKILEAEHVRSGGLCTAFIFTAPLCALPLVQSRWPGTVKHGVCLTPSELKEWHIQYVHQEGEFWWFAYQWWEIEDKIEGTSLWFRDGPPKLPSEMTPWLVRCGLQWGSLAGGEKAELWGWNGSKEQLIRLLGVCDY